MNARETIVAARQVARLLLAAARKGGAVYVDVFPAADAMSGPMNTTQDDEELVRCMVDEVDEAVVAFTGENKRYLNTALFIGGNGFDAISDYKANQWGRDNLEPLEDATDELR